MKKLSLTIFMFTSFVLTTYAHNNNGQAYSFKHVNDSLKTILLSKIFTLQEEYVGDWGGHLQSFMFTIKGKSVKVLWKNCEVLNTGKDLEIVLSVKDLDTFTNIFLNCPSKIESSKNASTEHIFYKFNNKNLTYMIDDKFTMECNEDFKAWKKMLLLEWQKQKK